MKDRDYVDGFNEFSGVRFLHGGKRAFICFLAKLLQLRFGFSIGAEVDDDLESFGRQRIEHWIEEATKIVCGWQAYTPCTEAIVKPATAKSKFPTTD